MGKDESITALLTNQENFEPCLTCVDAVSNRKQFLEIDARICFGKLIFMTCTSLLEISRAKHYQFIGQISNVSLYKITCETLQLTLK